MAHRRRSARGLAVPCPHNEAYLHRLDDIRMWSYACPCGLVAYGLEVFDAFRVFRRKAPGFRVGRPYVKVE